MSKIYLAGKLHSGELSISEFANELEDRGHTVLEKWWQKKSLPTPYLENVSTSAPAAETMIKAAYDSDVSILFPNEQILGAAVEFGAAIASTIERPEKQVIVVNPFETRQSVFYAHPSVIAIRGLTEVRHMKWY